MLCLLPQVLVRWACDKISASAGGLGDEALLEALQVCWAAPLLISRYDK